MGHSKKKKAGSVKKAAKAAAERALRKQVTIKGHGDYRPTSFQRVRGKGDYFGDVLGGLGQKLGNWAQGKFRTLTGMGDYKTKGPNKNSLVKMVQRAAQTDAENKSNGPSQNPFEMGAMGVKFSGKAPRIQHREYICPILAPSNPADFNTQVFPIQPGLSGVNSVMPWGGTVFRNFLEYELHGGVFEFVSCSSNFSASSALGTVSMSTLYDASEPTLDSLLAVNNNEYTTMAPPSASFYHPLECAPKDQPVGVRFVRSGNVPAGSDSRFDDFGRFQITTSGLSAPAGTKLGDLYFSYDIEVMKAIMPDLHVGTTAQVTTGLQTTMDILWDTTFPDPENSLPVKISRVTGGAATTAEVKVTMPSDYNGNYLAILAYVADGASNFGSTATSAIQAPTFGPDITNLGLMISNSTTLPSSLGVSNSLSGFAGNSMVMIWSFSSVAKKESDNWFRWKTTVSANPATGVRGLLFILPLDNDITDAFGLFNKLKRANPNAAKMASIIAQLETCRPNPAPTSAASSSALPVRELSNLDWNGSELGEEKKEDEELEKSVHIDRKTLETLLSTHVGSGARYPR